MNQYMLLSFSNSLLSIRNEKGENIELSTGNVFNREEFFSKSNGWELILLIDFK